MVSLWRAISALWVRTQVSLRGQYSVARLAALEEYYRTASTLRVALVLALVPIPVVVVIGAMTVIPLKDPSSGWTANGGFWVYIGIGTVLITEGIFRQAQHMIPELPISTRKRMTLSLALAVCMLACLVALAATWTFPVPFIIVIATLGFGVLVVPLSACAVDHRAIVSIPVLRPRLYDFSCLIVTQMTPLFVYPVFNALYIALQPPLRVIFVLLLPLTRMVLGNLAAHYSRYWEDHTPATAVFTVDVFTAFYAMTFMQNAGSALSAALLLTVDIIYLVFCVIKTLRRFNRLRHTYPKRAHDQANLLNVIRQLCFNPEQLDPSIIAQIQLFGSQHSQRFKDSTTREAISKIEALGLYAQPKWWPSSLQSSDARVPRHHPQPSQRVTMTAVVPFSSASFGPAHANAQFVNESLRMLFQYELTGLAEYVECVIPFIYFAYSNWLRYVPNLQYFPELRDMPDIQVATTNHTILLYGSIQCVSLFALHVALYRRLGFSSLHQLAFALESHLAIVQNNLVMTVVLITAVGMAHSGSDFTLRFDWIE